jgi:hypothetical protein
VHLIPAGDRFETTQPGIRTRHCFAAGAHYDPARLSFGALIGMDEHRLDPSAGFAEHAHRGVEIVSWVQSGALRHRDHRGVELIVATGQALRQCCGTGTRHTEQNASADEALLFVQLTLLGPADAPAGVVDPQVVLSAGRVVLLESGRHRVDAPAFGYVLSGLWALSPDDGSQPGDNLEPGDAAIIDRPASLAGEGQVLLVTLRQGPTTQGRLGAEG